MEQILGQELSIAAAGNLMLACKNHIGARLAIGHSMCAASGSVTERQALGSPQGDIVELTVQMLRLLVDRSWYFTVQ